MSAYPRAISGRSDLYAPTPAARLEAARAIPGRRRRRLERLDKDWPPFSPGAANAWLLLVTTNPPGWRDPLLEWPAGPLTLAEPHDGFLYPDPLGFWAEVRRWATVLLKCVEPGWGLTDALSVSALVHLGDHPDRLSTAVARCRPRVVLFLDEQAWKAGGWEVVLPLHHHLPDPHRAGVVYQGFWGRRKDGTIVGKSPQHPASHRLYRAEDMDGFLRALPS